MRIEKRQNCVIAYASDGGGISLRDFPKIAAQAPKGAVLDIHAARLLGALVVTGLREDLDRLRIEAEPEALARAHRTYANACDRMSPEALRWLAVGRQGSSSLALFAATVNVTPDGMDRNDLTAAPHDGGDFCRCADLYDAVPEVQANLSKARDISPEWAAMIDRWDDLLVVYYAEEWRELNALVKEIRAQAARNGSTLAREAF